MSMGFSWNLESLPLDDGQGVWLVLLLAGLIYCFLGYRLFRLVLALTGFVLAGAAAGTIAGWLSHGNLIAVGIALAVGGVCGAMALFFLYRLGVFCVGLLAGAMTAWTVLQGRQDSWVVWATLGAGFASGLLALAVERPLMKAATAAIGAWLCVCAAFFLFAQPYWGERLADPEFSRWAHLGAVGVWGMFTALGCAAQWHSGAGKKKGR